MYDLHYHRCTRLLCVVDDNLCGPVKRDDACDRIEGQTNRDVRAEVDLLGGYIDIRLDIEVAVAETVRRQIVFTILGRQF